MVYNVSMVERNKKGQVVSGKLYNKTGVEHSRYKHGMAKTIFYSKWSGMLRRCNNPKDKAYERYGKVGIKVSKSWLDFQNFYNDMFPTYKSGLQIDRVDNSKGYSKENCRWVTIKEQANNKKSVVLYTNNGLTMCSTDWDKRLGLAKGTVRYRIKYAKWGLEKALTEPKKKPVGCYKDERGGYKVQIKHKGKQYFVGRYKTLKEAEQAKKNWILLKETDNK